MEAVSLSQFKSQVSKGAIPLDVRTPEEFAQKFLKGSLYGGESADAKEFARLLGYWDSPLILITQNGNEEEARVFQAQSSLPGISGFLEGGMEAGEAAGVDLDMIIEVDPDELALDLPHDDRILVVDVRVPAAYAAGHVENALNLPLDQMSDLALVAQLEEDQNIYVYSDLVSGGMLAASILKRQEYHNLRLVSGGWEWIRKEPGIPVEVEKSPKEPGTALPGNLQN